MRLWLLNTKLGCFTFICLISPIIILKLKPELNSSSSSISISDIESFGFQSKNSSFRTKLIYKRLKSHSRMYDHVRIECNISQPLNIQLENEFIEISKTLSLFQQKIISYPNEHFQGRGIVLTGGSTQLRYIKVNIKLIELSGTQLPVQVNRIRILYYFK